MKIAEVRAERYDVPLLEGRESLSAAYTTPGSYLHAVGVTVVLDDGSVGTAEVPIRPYVYGDTQPAVEYMVANILGPKCVGVSPFELDDLLSRFDPPRGVVGNLVAKGGIDVAVHDALARALGLPVYSWLGAAAPGRHAVPLTWLLPLHAPDKVISEGVEAYSRGYRSFKVKVGRPGSLDVEVIAGLRRELGTDAVIYADANEAYSLDRAERLVGAMADNGLAWIEDPCPINIDIRARARLAARLPVPVLGDASCHRLVDAHNELAAGACSMVMLKLPRNGYRGGRAMLDLARGYGARCVLGTQGESAYGSVAAAHLALVAGFIEFAELSFLERMAFNTAAAGFEIADGQLRIGAGPGIGVELVRPTAAPLTR